MKTCLVRAAGQCCVVRQSAHWLPFCAPVSLCGSGASPDISVLHVYRIQTSVCAMAVLPEAGNTWGVRGGKLVHRGSRRTGGENDRSRRGGLFLGAFIDLSSAGGSHPMAGVVVHMTEGRTHVRRHAHMVFYDVVFHDALKWQG
jgi:hypothetical protein